MQGWACEGLRARGFGVLSASGGRGLGGYGVQRPTSEMLFRD